MIILRLFTVAALVALGAYVHISLNRAETALRAIEASQDKILANSPCAPVYAAIRLDWSCPTGFGWMGGLFRVCDPEIEIYRHDDLNRVQKWIQKGGALAVYEERGVRERELRLHWDARIEK